MDHKLASCSKHALLCCVAVVAHGVMLVLSDMDHNVWVRGHDLHSSELCICQFDMNDCHARFGSRVLRLHEISCEHWHREGMLPG